MAALGMHQELVDILIAEDVSAVSIDVIANKKILTIKAFANVVTGKDQVGVLLKGTPQEDNMPDIAGMRQAWRICEIANDKALESMRSTPAAGEARSSPVDDLDQPLLPPSWNWNVRSCVSTPGASCPLV